MNSAAREILAATRKVVAFQLVAGAVIAAAFFVGKGQWEAVSAFYGAATSVVIALFLSRGVVKAADVAPHDQKKSMWILYFGAVQRFLLVLAFFGLGLAILKLAPLAMVIGFAGAQLVYVVAMRRG